VNPPALRLLKLQQTWAVQDTATRTIWRTPTDPADPFGRRVSIVRGLCQHRLGGRRGPRAQLVDRAHVPSGTGRYLCQQPECVCCRRRGAPPGGAVKRADGSFQLNSFWPFGSGSDYADWLMLGAEVVDEKGQAEDWGDFLIPPEDIDNLDDWQ
jgi:hypothetical protein